MRSFPLNSIKKLIKNKKKSGFQVGFRVGNPIFSGIWVRVSGWEPDSFGYLGSGFGFGFLKPNPTRKPEKSRVPLYAPHTPPTFFIGKSQTLLFLKEHEKL